MLVLCFEEVGKMFFKYKIATIFNQLPGIT